MVITRSLSFLLLAVFASVLFARTAIAQYEDTVAYNSGTMVVTVFDNNPMIFPRDFYGVRAFRDPFNPATDLTLRFMSMGNVTGCAHMTDFVVNANIKKSEMKVTAVDREIELKKQKRQYHSHDCETEMLESYFDLPINVNDLRNNKVQKISIKSGKYGSFIDLFVNTTNEKIVFSSNFKPFPGFPGAQVSMDYWLYPPRTVILSAPQAKLGQNVTQELIDFGINRGLKPLDEVLSGFHLDHGDDNYYFFFDPTGETRDRLTAPDETIIVGKIQKAVTVYTAKGPEEELVDLDVHASMPGVDQ